MISLDAIDLEFLMMALEHQTDFYDSFWWFDPDTGEIGFWLRGAAEESVEELEERGVITIDPISSRDGYREMEDFISTVSDDRSRDLLQQAIDRKRPFRRFKDTLIDLPELGDQWFTFHDRTVRTHAIEWLVDAGVVDRAEAEQALAQGPDAGRKSSDG
ncbi:UPF0158 family protein [Arthrobacter castelli]|uniref:UPF0158 family protein n=1 Tax=Arthrobacter castelli TaxID=271431 RepID=UPI0004169993|nr:UPF0158 family protein [Arthrobacter castelli]